MACSLAPLQTRLNDFLLQHQVLLQPKLWPNQHRFPTLRTVGYGFVDLSILIVVFIVDGIAVGFNFICLRLVYFWNRCHILITNASNKLAIISGLVANTFLDRYNAMKSFTVAFCRSVRDAALDLWIAISRHLAHLLPSRQIFCVFPTTSYFMVFGLCIYLQYFLFSHYAAATDSVLGFAISTIISTGVLLSRWSHIFKNKNAQVLHCLEIPAYFVPTFLMLYGILFESNCDLLNLPSTIRPLDYLPSDLSIALPSDSLTLPAWLHRPHVLVIGILFSGYLLSIAVHALYRGSVNVMTRLTAPMRPYWQPYRRRLQQQWYALEAWMRNCWTAIEHDAARICPALSAGLSRVTSQIRTVTISIRAYAEAHSSVFVTSTIFTLAFAVLTSNRDFANILSTLITTAIDYDFSVLSLAFKCLRLATRICIWLAHYLIFLHQRLEDLSLDDKQWAWVARADWLEGCVCTLVIAAVFYTALFLCRSILNAIIRGSIRNAAVGSRDWVLAKFNGTINRASITLDPDEDAQPIRLDGESTKSKEQIRMVNEDFKLPSFKPGCGDRHSQ